MPDLVKNSPPAPLLGGTHMTKSTNHPDADYTPSDIGPTEKQLEMTPEEAKAAWDAFHDEETNELIMSERNVF